MTPAAVVKKLLEARERERRAATRLKAAVTRWEKASRRCAYYARLLARAQNTST